MQIDWFTFFAQIVNFFILLALLRHFLYGPIMAAMDEREAKLAQSFQEAERAQADAQAEAQLLEQERAELDAARQRLLAEAAADAADSRKRMLVDARAEVDDLSARWYERVEQERSAFLHAIRERIGAEVVQVARHVLADLSDTALEAQIAMSFAQHLLNLSAQERHALIVSGAGFDEDVILRSTFALSEEAHREIINSLQQLLVMDARYNGNDYAQIEEIGIRFERTDDLICGVELIVCDRRVAWSIDDYLAALGEDLLDAAETEAEQA